MGMSLLKTLFQASQATKLVTSRATRVIRNLGHCGTAFSQVFDAVMIALLARRCVGSDGTTWP